MTHTAAAFDVLARIRSGESVDEYGSHFPRIECADGESLSVQVGKYLYSSPRENTGPWTAVEVGFPSIRPEPWDEWEPYCEDATRPLETVYGYIPLDIVERFVAAHGGQKL